MANIIGLTVARDAMAGTNIRTEGIAAAEFLHDYNLQTSRGFRALKIWMAIKENGLEKFGRLIDQNISQAHYLTALINQEPHLELMAPTTINIVSFRFNPPGVSEESLKSLNLEITLRMQESDIAALSDTTIHGRHCLRVAITNHWSRRTDLDLMIRAVLDIGAELVA